MTTDQIVLVSFWAIVFILTLFHEIESFNLTTIWFCISAFISLILALFDVHYMIQISVFLVLSIVLLIATKPLVKKLKDKPIERTNTDRIIGLIAVVTKEVDGINYGEVVINNNYWRAINYNHLKFSVGEEVIIKNIEGIKVIIEKKGEEE